MVLLSLALSFAERNKHGSPFALSWAERAVHAKESHAQALVSSLPAKLPAVLAGALLASSMADMLGISVTQLLPQAVREGGEEAKAKFLSMLGLAVKADADAHPSTAAAEGAVEKAKPKKVRILGFDSIRFFLIAYIMSGHFISFAHPGKFAFRAITQINVVVGAFFALSGYVAAYTTTELQELKASDKLLKTPTPKWILQKVFGYYPLHLFVLTLFSPMFLYSDVHFSGWPTAIADGLLELTLSQAWFPMHAEVWNAPTWFLSALSYATVILRFALPVIAKQTKKQLTHTAGFLFLFGLVPKLGYCDDHDAWGLLEGALPAKKMPNLAIFNTQRFNPLYASIEVLMGAVACRLVMLDGAPGEGEAPKTHIWNSLVPLLAMVDIVLLRARGRIHLSDVLTRGVIFIPLFLRFLMSVHRASVKKDLGDDPVVKVLNHPLLIQLGNISFPIFVVHGPIGQLFYKKLIATKIFGAPLDKKIGPNFFYVYLATCVAAAKVLEKTFLSSKKVAELSNASVEELSSFL